MNMQLEKVPGWIYNLADYKQMFDLSSADMTRKILDFPGGISSFNKEMLQLGHTVISGDEYYSLDEAEMKKHIAKRLSLNEKMLREHLGRLKVSDEKSLQKIITAWHQSADLFLNDYKAGRASQRYQAMSMPKLPFDNGMFDLVLCRDILFHSQTKENYQPQELLVELCRVANEVRVYPLQDESGEMPQELGPIMLMFQQNNFGVEVREVKYELQKGGNAMLRVWAKECFVE